MIKRQQKKYGWEFMFIGANIDAYAEAKRFGIRKDRTVNYVHDSLGTEKVYGGVSMALCSVMMSDDEDMDEAFIGSRWSEGITEDYNTRGRK